MEGGKNPISRDEQEVFAELIPTIIQNKLCNKWNPASGGGLTFLRDNLVSMLFEKLAQRL